MANIERIKEILKNFGLNCEIIEFSQTTRTSLDAAKAIGCRVEQIGKSIIFRGINSNKAYLVIASGGNRINEERFSKIVGEAIEKGNPDFVREKTGFIIGGVPPFGHKEPLETFIDEDLFLYDEIWCAGGTPNTVFKLTPQDLLKITQAKVISVKS